MRQRGCRPRPGSVETAQAPMLYRSRSDAVDPSRLDERHRNHEPGTITDRRARAGVARCAHVAVRPDSPPLSGHLRPTTVLRTSLVRTLQTVQWDGNPRLR